MAPIYKKQIMKIIKLLFLLVFISGCELPAYDVDKEAVQFKKENPTAYSTIKFEDRNIHYLKYGNPTAQPVVFVHGSPGSLGGWIRYINDPELNKKFYLISIDRPGFGNSGFGISEPSIDKQAEALYAVIEAEKLTNPILVGHSLGGPVIARMAMNHPDQIYGLVFVAASVSPDLEETKWFQYPARWFGIKQIIPTELRVCNEEIMALKENLIEMLPMWSKIKAKTIIIHGDEDDLVPIANKDFLLKQLNPAVITDVVVIDKMNHFIPWKKPFLIKQAIIKLKRN
ncbi:alpha/beta hydrolase [Bdellovibrio sp. qaytius]|nr:alpha/beta hydrolase [Bdellovibrio sp. qaytius]